MTDPVFESAPMFYFSTDDDGVILDINQRLCVRLGYDKAFLTGQKQDIFFSRGSGIFCQTHLFPVLKVKGMANEVSITLYTADKKQLSVLFNVERTADEEKPIVHFAGIELIQRKEYEDRLLSEKRSAEAALVENPEFKELTTQLQQKLEELELQLNVVKKQRNELKQFNKVITHDLEEPMRKLSHFANILSDSTNPEKNKLLLKNLLESARKTKSVISALQQYIWLSETALNITAIDFNDVVNDALGKLAGEWPDIVLIPGKEKLPVLSADGAQMQLLFDHLISNAVQFRRKGNKVRIKFTATSLKLNKFQHTENKYDYVDYMRFEIEDDGIGFGNENQEEVFDLFRTLHDISGTGIGLALCKMIIENHGGTIFINSSVDLGTTVTFTLPVNDMLNLKN